MARSGRVTHIGTFGVIAMLVLKNTLKHNEFLTACVNMLGKTTISCISHYSCGTGNLFANAIQHAPIYPRHRGSKPRFFAAMH
jgi:hypothetical protein